MKTIEEPCPFCSGTSRVEATFSIKALNKSVNTHGVLCTECFGVVFSEPDKEVAKGKPPFHVPYNSVFPEVKEDEVEHYYNCPECEKFISNNVDEKRIFCSYCGQKIDWSGL